MRAGVWQRWVSGVRVGGWVRCGIEEQQMNVDK